MLVLGNNTPTFTERFFSMLDKLLICFSKHPLGFSERKSERVENNSKIKYPRQYFHLVLIHCKINQF